MKLNKRGEAEMNLIKKESQMVSANRMVVLARSVFASRARVLAAGLALVYLVHLPGTLRGQASWQYGTNSISATPAWLQIQDRGDGCCAAFVMNETSGQQTHFYTYSSGTFGIHKYGPGSANGQVFTLTPSGSVGIGIGTTSPAAALTVNTGGSQGSVGLSNTVLAQGYQTAFQVLTKKGDQNWYFGVDDADSNKLKIGRGFGPGQGFMAITVDTSDRVGIGTNTPSALLEVNGPAKFDQPVTFASGQTFPGATFTGSETVQGNVSAGGFTGNGSGLTGVNAASLGGQPASSFANLTTTNTFSANQSFLGSVGIGVGSSTPKTMLELGPSKVGWGGGSNALSGLTLHRPDNSGIQGIFFGEDSNGTSANGTNYWENMQIYNQGGGSNIVFVNGNGPTEAMRITPSGTVLIGTAVSPTTAPGQTCYSSTIGCELVVDGAIATKEIVVTNSVQPDYVFKPDYRLRALEEVGAYVQEHHHLPGIPSESEVAEKGVNLGDMQAKLLEKVEELTLYVIQADERNTRLEQQNKELQQRVERLEARP